VAKSNTRCSEKDRTVITKGPRTKLRNNCLKSSD
jgi:hypothetical protein